MAAVCECVAFHCIRGVSCTEMCTLLLQERETCRWSWWDISIKENEIRQRRCNKRTK